METAESRATRLAEESLDHFKSGRQDDAARSLREALSLAPQNPKVLAVLRFIQEDASIPAVSKLVHRFATEDDAAAGQEALRGLRDPNASLQTSVAVGLVEILEGRVEQLSGSIAGQLVAESLRLSRGAREHVAGRLGSTTEDTLDLFCKFGDDALDVLVDILVDPMFWENAELGSRCLKVCFRLFISKLSAASPLLSAGTARSVSRLLAARPQELCSQVNQEALEKLLSLLDSTALSDIRSRSALAVAKFVEQSEDIAHSMIAKFLSRRLTSSGDEDLHLVFSIVAALFPLVPQVSAKLFLGGGFIEDLPTLLQGKPVDVETAALEMLSAACTDQACRVAIVTHCKEYLYVVMKSDASSRSIAAVILAKTTDSTVESGSARQKRDADELATVFQKLVVAQDPKLRDVSIEGLAYTSLKGPVKESLARDKAALESVMGALRASTGNPTALFGALTVISNLVAYAPTLTEEQKKVAELKKYADAKPNARFEPEPEDEDSKVTARCIALLDAGVVPALVACGKSLTPNAALAVSNILLSLAKHQGNRGIIAQQGGVKLSLQLYLTTINDGALGRQLKEKSAHALAKILVSVNPSHVFSSQVTITSAVRPLFSLLEGTDDRKDLLPVFECLLALTNLASLDDGTRQHIIRIGWTKIEELLLSDNSMVQRAAVELICNLMASPQGAAKYADGSKAAESRLHVLLALADADDLGTRSAAGGALAMLTEWDKACEAVVKRPRGISIILTMVAEDNEQMRHRGIVILRNIACGSGGFQDVVKGEGGIDVVRNALKSTRQPEILAIGVEVLKTLMA